MPRFSGLEEIKGGDMCKINSFKVLFLCIFAVGVLLGGSVLPVAAAPSGAPAELKIAFVDYLSGPAAIAGNSGRNAVEWAVDKYNKEGGISGVPIKLVVLDENGGPAKMVTEFRRLVMEEKVNAILGYTSSADVLALAPVSEELKTLTIIAIPGTHRLYEEHKLKYMFRASNSQAADSVMLARYVLKLKPNIKSIAGINEDYAFGRDNWGDFKDAMLALKPDVEVKSVLWTKFQAGEYSAEISRLLAAKPDVIHSSFWAAGLITFLKQAAPRGLFKQSLAVLACGTQIDQYIKKDMPDGLVICPRATASYFIDPDPEKDPMQKEFLEGFRKKSGGLIPCHAAYRNYYVIAGMKAAYEKAISQTGGRWPTTDEVVEAFRGLTWKVPGDQVRMRQDNQAVHDGLVGISKISPKYGFPIMDKEERYPVEKIMPPMGMKTADWMKTLKP
jgi:branched-chain amino acid transport system substrate-binding protein